MASHPTKPFLETGKSRPSRKSVFCSSVLLSNVKVVIQAVSLCNWVLATTQYRRYRSAQVDIQ